MSASPAHRAAQAAHDAARARGATRVEATQVFYAAQEAAHGHRDGVERARLLGQIVMAGIMRGLDQSAHEAACGLPDGALSDGSVLTPGLHAALARIRGGAS